MTSTPAPTWRAHRDYQVRPSLPTDHPALADGSARPEDLITIERHDGRKMILPSGWWWNDSDAWARRRWARADREFRDMIKSGEIPGAVHG